MRVAGFIGLLGLVGCASPPEPCCTGMAGKELSQPTFLHRRDIPEITAIVRSKTKDGFVGQIWWTGPTEALVCVSDGCWEVLRSSDGHWDTGSHWPKLTPEQKNAWSEEQHNRLVAP